MGADLFVQGFAQPNKEFKQMLEAFNACKRAGVEPPKEVWDFFNWENPSPHGIPVEKDSLTGITEKCVDGTHSYIVEIDKLPPEIETIEIGISY